MARIQFKGKIESMTYVDETKSYDFIQCPVLDRKHCDMNAFRIHPKYGSYANSDLFPGMLRRIRTELFGEYGKVKLNSLPVNVSVDASGFLAKVTIEV